MSTDDNKFGFVFRDAVFIGAFGIFATVFFSGDFDYHFIYGLWCCFFCLTGFFHVPAQYYSTANPSYKIYVWISYWFLILAIGGWFFLWSYNSIRRIPKIQTVEWQPPLLKNGQSNVIIWFGSQGQIYPASVDGQPVTAHPTSVQVTNLSPDERQILLKTPGYNKRIGIVTGEVIFPKTFSGKPEEFPVWPNNVSNRVYVDVVVPFLNERRTIFLNHDYLFDLTKQLPSDWDFNFNADSNVFEIVNERTNPVLQVIYKAANEVQVNGIFIGNKNDVFMAFDKTPALFIPFSTSPFQSIENQTTQTLTLTDIKNNYQKTHSNVLVTDVFLPTNWIYDMIFFTNFQNAIFKYPGIDFPGQFAKKSNLLVRSYNQPALIIAWAIIDSGIVWVCFGWIFFQKRRD